jgi:hypothetical protein
LTIIVLTRFLDRKRWSPARFSNEFVATRLQVLKTSAMKSLEAQRFQRFQWLVSVSSELDSAPIKEFLEDGSNLSLDVVVQDGAEHSASVFARHLCRHEGPYWTVRLDYDDFLHPKFLERVGALSEKTGTVVSFPKGVIIDFGRGTIGIRNWVNTPILAYLGSGGSSVYSLGHHSSAAQRVGHLKIVRTWEPMWLISIKTGNAANRTQPWDRPSRRSRFAKIFGLDEFQVNEGPLSYGIRWVKFLEYKAFFLSRNLLPKSRQRNRTNS